MSFPRYPEYKDSGIAWLGDVPRHWDLTPFYSVATERNESNAGMLEDNLLSLSYGRIVPKDISSNEGLLPESFETYQIVRPGDIVFRLTDLQNDKRSLRTALVDDTGIITSAYVAAMPIAIVPGYLAHLLRAYDVTKVFYSMGGGLRQSMKFSDLKHLPTLKPPMDEQKAIAAFLDRETSKINALVTEQEKLIALLKEKRQAVISHAVTKGLDPNVPMKDSGIEWLGKVPTHWDVCSIRRVVSAIEQGWSPECISRPADDNEWGVLKAGCINRGLYDQRENKALPSELTPAPEYEVRVGDVLMSRASGSPELVGSTALIKSTREKLMLSDKIFRLRFEPQIEACFFVAALNSRPLRSQIKQALSGGNGLANNLPQSSLLGFFLCVPPVEEQKLICTFLEVELTKIDALIGEAEKGIALLKERRSTLISSAVIGKVDVRGLAGRAQPASQEMAGSPA